MNLRHPIQTELHEYFSSIDFISKLAALTSPPRLNLIRFYGGAPDSNVHAEVKASQRGKNNPRLAQHLKDSDKPCQREPYHAKSMSVHRS